MAKAKDRTGQRFGRLVVISGQTRSCGCLRKESARINGCKRAKRASAL